MGYHPNYHLAKEFYYCRNTKGAIWDFSIHTSQKLKYQVFTILNYALESSLDRELRRGYLAPLHFLYMYCIDREVSDLTRLEQDQIDDYAGKAKEVPLINNRYHQIVDKVQRILSVQSKDINWEANVWYLERFQFDATRYDPTRPVKRISFLDISDKDNREYHFCLNIISGSFAGRPKFSQYCLHSIGLTKLGVTFNTANSCNTTGWMFSVIIWSKFYNNYF